MTILRTALVAGALALSTVAAGVAPFSSVVAFGASDVGARNLAAKGAA